MKDALDRSETVREKIIKLANEAQIVAVEFVDGQLVEMVTEKA